MSDITPSSPAAFQPTSDIPQHPSDILLELVVGLLAPMFLLGSGGNVGHARLAALETVNAYRVETQADLIAVAQIVAFGFAALASLGLSMQDDLTPSMALRLRSNAAACCRAAEQNRRTLATHRSASRPDRPRASTPSPREASLPGSGVPSSVGSSPVASAQPAPAPGPLPFTPPPARQDQRARWEEAMASVAADYEAEAASLSPDARADAVFRAALLSSCANDLLAPSGMAKPCPRPGGHSHPPLS